MNVMKLIWTSAFTLVLSVGVAIGLGACASKDKEAETSVAAPAALPSLTLEEAVSNNQRTPENKVRDAARHPLETLKFFEITPDMSVVEIWPSGGWYTQILAPYLAAKGKYIIADPPSDPRGYTAKRVEWLAARPDLAAKIGASVFAPGQETEIAPLGSVDRVLTFRNIHSWNDEKTQEKAFQTFFAALKPGGMLGVVEHRAAKGKKVDATKGYVPEDKVIAMATKAGFKLAGKSEINANPKDKKNYAKGVWTLPPTLAEGEKDRAKYVEIGESDRMTLKFIKPMTIAK